MEQLDQMRRNRIVLLSIIGIPLMMILAASWLWYFVVQGDLDLVGTLGTANRGSLVQPPRQLDEVEMKEENGDLFRYADLESRWTMLVPSEGSDCGADCEYSLYVTRQIHVAMGKEFNRLRRLFISNVAAADTRLDIEARSDTNPAPTEFSPFLKKEHRDLRAVVTTSPAMMHLFPEYGLDRSTWYLVDPAGWVMMSYDSETPYRDVIADLKFLLKNSSE